MASDFTLHENWVGGSYEFVILIKPPSNHDLLSSLKRLWSHQTLDGCYNWSVKDVSQSKQDLSILNFEQFKPWERYIGRATLPNRQSVICFTYTYHGGDEDQEPYSYDVDYLYFAIPIGALSKCYSIGAYPFDNEMSRPWVQSINTWFYEICVYVYKQVPFHMAMIGGDCSPDFLVDRDFFETYIPPTTLYNAFAIPKKGKLVYYPATN